MNCTVIGLGYIGLPTSAILANAGHQVLGVDINEKILNTLKEKKIHINEPGLYDLVIKNIEEKNLTFSKNIETSDVFIITVPTPFKAKDTSKIS